MVTPLLATARKTRPAYQRLDERLVLRNPRNERDIERCAEFVSVTMRETSGITTERVLHHFPGLTLDDFWFVEDEERDEVVSNLCLIPWQCRFGTLTLDVAMLEIVATHPHYRKRGLIRTQIEMFHQAVREQDFDFSIIEGIPYYYRQFGYAYATDHAAMDTLASSHIPELPAGLPPLRVRAATLADIPCLEHLYDGAHAALDIATIRTEETWRYVLDAADYPMYILEHEPGEQERGGKVAGYVCAWRQANGDIRINESGIPSAATALAFLHLCKQNTTGDIQIRWPQESTLVQVSRTLGGTPLPSDQWLIRLNDLPRLLTKLAPLFEERLAQSTYLGFTGDVLINLFRQAYRLHFAQGQLLEVKALGFVDASMGADGGDLCIPPDAFVRLLLGYRSLHELWDAWPDIVVRASRRHLLDTLFPKCRAYFSMPYFYHGTMERLW